MRLQDFDNGERYRARILSNSAITAPGAAEEVRELALEVECSKFEFGIGQSVGVIVEGPFRQSEHPDLEIGHAHHFRLYTVADTPAINARGKPEIKLCVRRCHYLDEHSGEEYPGIASNYLCDRRTDDIITINGPFGLPFEVPADKDADLLLISMGTGIAPFRALVKHLYRDVGDWRGRVRLFHGARSGLEMLYMNDQVDDFAQYYDEETFQAFQSISPRPHWGDPADMRKTLLEKGEDVLAILRSDKGYVYVAGREDTLESLENIFATLLGSAQEWQDLKRDKSACAQWRELIY
jgi:ferredoxin--NADP+ reductase